MTAFLWYAARRLVLLVPFLVGLTVLSFLLGVFSPGDPAVAVLTMDGTAEPTAEEIETMRAAMGLDRPLPVQYGAWLLHAMQGDLGVSYLTGRPVLTEILRRFPVTVHLSLWAMGWILAIAIPLGLWSAMKKDQWPELLLRVGTLLFISVPAFWLAILGMLIFSEELRLLPSSGYGGARHMVLPSFVLASGTIAATIRLQQASVLAVLQKPFIVTERAKGLPMGYILRRHVLMNALMPVVTMLGTYFGSILGGSVIIEQLFSIPGMGSYVLSAIWARDYPVIQGYVIVSGTVFLVFNYLVDLSYYVLDPASRKGEEP